VLPNNHKRLVAVSPNLKPLGDTESPEVPGTGRLALSVNGRDSTIVLSRAGSTRAATLRWPVPGLRKIDIFGTDTDKDDSSPRTTSAAVSWPAASRSADVEFAGGHPRVQRA